MHAALKQCEELLVEFGGHKHAAGITIELDKIDEFNDRFENIVKESLPKDTTIPDILIDSELNFTELSPILFKTINKFSPFGFSNSRPLFLSRDVKSSNGYKQIGINRVKFRAVQGNFVIDAVLHNLNHKLQILQSNKPFSIIYNLETFLFNGHPTPQLAIKDIQVR